MHQALAVDIGGTKVATALVDEKGEVTHHHTALMVDRPDADAEEVFRVVVDCARTTLRAAGIRWAPAVGCGCGGPMRWPDGILSPLNIPAWRGFPLRDRLGEALGTDRVAVHNDAIALAAGEHWQGIAAGTDNLLAVTVSTGVGGGIVLGGRLQHGASGNCGHIGHIVVRPDGPECACGGRGCLEAIASGPSSVRRARELGWEGLDGQLDGVTLAAAAGRGHEPALQAVREAGEATGTALASAVQLLDVATVVVAGGFSRSGPPFWDTLHAAYRRHAGLSFTADTRVLPSSDVGTTSLQGVAAFVLLPEAYGW